MEGLTAATHTARLTAAVMAIGAVSVLCQIPCGDVQRPKTLKQTKLGCRSTCELLSTNKTLKLQRIRCGRK